MGGRTRCIKGVSARGGILLWIGMASVSAVTVSPDVDTHASEAPPSSLCRTSYFFPDFPPQGSTPRKPGSGCPAGSTVVDTVKACGEAAREMGFELRRLPVMQDDLPRCFAFNGATPLTHLSIQSEKLYFRDARGSDPDSRRADNSSETVARIPRFS